MGYYGSVVMNYQSFGGDKETWVYNRIVPIKCDNVIEEKDQDKHLVEHLLEEAEYIVSLAVKGLKQVINNGYKYDIPECCKTLNVNYQYDNNSFLSFYKECVIDRSKDLVIDKCTTRKFYDIYRAWCKDNNQGYTETKKEVKKILLEMNKGDKIKTNGYWYYKDITLNIETKKYYEDIYGDFEEYEENIPCFNSLPEVDGSNNVDGLLSAEEKEEMRKRLEDLDL